MQRALGPQKVAQAGSGEAAGCAGHRPGAQAAAGGRAGREPAGGPKVERTLWAGAACRASPTCFPNQEWARDRHALGPPAFLSDKHGPLLHACRSPRCLLLDLSQGSQRVLQFLPRKKPLFCPLLVHHPIRGPNSALCQCRHESGSSPVSQSSGP